MTAYAMTEKIVTAVPVTARAVQELSVATVFVKLRTVRTVSHAPRTAGANRMENRPTATAAVTVMDKTLSVAVTHGASAENGSAQTSLPALLAAGTTAVKE
jgi:hypothetical protein